MKLVALQCALGVYGAVSVSRSDDPQARCGLVTTNWEVTV